jgi:hypothetical protein
MYRFYRREDALDCMKYISGTKVDDRPIRTGMSSVDQIKFSFKIRKLYQGRMYLAFIEEYS